MLWFNVWIYSFRFGLFTSKSCVFGVHWSFTGIFGSPLGLLLTWFYLHFLPIIGHIIYFQLCWCDAGRSQLWIWLLVELDFIQIIQSDLWFHDWICFFSSTFWSHCGNTGIFCLKYPSLFSLWLDWGSWLRFFDYFGLLLAISTLLSCASVITKRLLFTHFQWVCLANIWNRTLIQHNWLLQFMINFQSRLLRISFQCHPTQISRIIIFTYLRLMLVPKSGIHSLPLFLILYFIDSFFFLVDLDLRSICGIAQQIDFLAILNYKCFAKTCDGI